MWLNEVVDSILKSGEETVASMSDHFYVGKQNVWSYNQFLKMII